MTRSNVQRRSAFTLIEILLVIVLMTIIAALAVKFLPNLNKNKGVPNAAGQLEGWIRVTKSQALRDGAPRGVRLIPDPNDSTRVTALQYIEQPEPLAPRGPYMRAFISTPNPNMPPQPPPYPNPSPATVDLFLIDPTNGAPVTPVSWSDQGGVQPGDFFELTVPPYGVYQIQAVVASPPPGVATVLSRLVLVKAVDGTDLGSSLILSDGFRIIRSPRPLVGEPLLQMNKDVYIDVATSVVPIGISGYPDILFNSSGQVANAPYGQYYLVVQHIDRPTDRLIVVIYTRTGKVNAVNWNDSGPDPYTFAKDGSAPGL